MLGAKSNPTTREGFPPIVGLDTEWKPGDNPVSILQVATRTEAFVVDLFAVTPSGSPACQAFDAFLGDMLSSDTVLKLGFSFETDLSGLRTSYPHLTSLGGKSIAMVDVKQLAYSASALHMMRGRIGLATLTKSVLGATLSKKQQCSNWARRPLTKAQLAYAAADAFYLNLIFDMCVAKSNGKLLTQLLKEREMLRENAIMTEAVNFCRKRRLYAKAALAAGKIDGLQ